MGQHITCIVNPKADKGKAKQASSALRPLIPNDIHASWVETDAPTHATNLAMKAVQERAEVIVAFGGDGTVHEIVNGIMQFKPDERPQLAIVPLGSGNDFSINAGIPENPEEAIQKAFNGHSKEVDVCVLEDDTNRKEYWINAMGIGFDADAAIHTKKSKHLKGFGMYLWAVIQTILHHHHIANMTIRTDAAIMEKEILMLGLCNGAREGGGFLVAPDASIDDGILDYALIGGVSRLKLFRLIPEVMRGTHGRFKEVEMGRFRELNAIFDRPMAIQLDGEIFSEFESSTRAISIKILPKALQVIN